MKVFLLIGQSNMAGPRISPHSKDDDARLEGVYLWNDRNE